MTDKELIRRALLGDQEAQQECTDKGIAIPCPFCQGDKTARRYVCGEGFVECLTCHATSSMRSNPDVSLKDWNTRPAQPVGRCKDCVWSREPTKEDYAEIDRDVLAYKDSLVCDFCEDARWKDDFCSYFKKREA